MTPIKIVFLGTGGYHPTETRQTSGVLLPELGVLFDAGTGVFRLTDHLKTEVLHLFLSHAHLDHIVGITYLLVPLELKRIKHVKIYGRPTVLKSIKTHLFAASIFPTLPNFEWISLAGRQSVTLPGGEVVTHQKLPSHPHGSTGFRLDRGEQSLAYITDTRTDGSYLEFIRGVKLLIHECNFPDHMAELAEKTGHSCTSNVAQTAVKADVGRLLLTHIDPYLTGDDPLGLARARGIFPRTEIATDLSEWNAE